jgi:hypothetical protein
MPHILLTTWGFDVWDKKQKASGSSSAVIVIVKWAKRACALAAVGEQYFAKPTDVKQAVGDLEAEKTQGTSCTPYSVLKRLPNVGITFLTKVFNAAKSRWCLSQHGTGHARFPYWTDERAQLCVQPFATCLLTQLPIRLRRRGVPCDEHSSSGQTSQNPANPLLWNSQQVLWRQKNNRCGPPR